MEKIIKELVTIKSSAENMGKMTTAALCIAGLVCVGSVAAALHFTASRLSDIYVLDHGSAFTASVGEEDSQRELEVQDHVARFHELLLNLSPSSEAIRTNIDRALTMSDRSAYNYWQDLSEQGFYQRLVSANISQQFSVDSLVTDMGVYPYRTRTYGKIYLLRESNITAYDVCTSCSVVDVGRSKGNPHGTEMRRTRNLARIVSEKIDAVRGNGNRLATALAGGCLVVALVKLIFILTN